MAAISTYFDLYLIIRVVVVTQAVTQGFLFLISNVDCGYGIWTELTWGK